MRDEQIISTDEFRKAAGKAAEQFSDAQAQELIAELDLIAGLFIEQEKAKLRENEASMNEGV